MKPILLLLVVAAIVSVIIAIARKTQAAWAEAARRLGLSHQSGSLIQSPVIRGRVKGFVVEVRVTGRGGKHNTTRYKVKFAALGLGLIVRRESFIDRALNRDDIQVGDQDFDPLYLIQGDEPDQVRAFLTPERRARIDRVLSSRAKCRVSDNEIRYKTRGVERDAGHIVSTVQAMVGLASVLSEDSQTEDSQSEAPAEPVTKAIAPEKVTPEPDRAGEMIVVPVPEVHAEAPPETIEISALASESVCRELFAKERMSFETSQVFDERFKGQRVRWRGTLDRFERFQDDPILGSGPGLKAVFDLPSTEDGVRAAHLVVAFPADEERGLTEARGGSLSFEGTLGHCDPYLWTVFLVDGARVT